MVIEEVGNKNGFPSIKENPGVKKWFSVDKKKSEVMGQNEPDFRNQHDKLSQKHEFVPQIQFDPPKMSTCVIKIVLY